MTREAGAKLHRGGSCSCSLSSLCFRISRPNELDGRRDNLTIGLERSALERLIDAENALSKLSVSHLRAMTFLRAWRAHGDEPRISLTLVSLQRRKRKHERLFAFWPSSGGAGVCWPAAGASVVTFSGSSDRGTRFLVRLPHAAWVTSSPRSLWPLGKHHSSRSSRVVRRKRQTLRGARIVSMSIDPPQ